MRDAALHVLRRGAEYLQQQSDGNEPAIQIEISGWALATLTLTLVLYYVAMFKVSYTICDVIGTLTIVEEPASRTLVEIFSEDEEGEEKKDTDKLLAPELLVVETRPATSKIRTAMKLLKSKGGRLARFRGLSLFLVYSALLSVAGDALGSFLPIPGGRMIGRIAAEVVLAPLAMTWVHIVISAPSQKPWYKRIPSGQWSKIAPAALLRAVALQSVVGFPMKMLCLSDAMKPLHQQSAEPSQKELRQAVAVTIGALVAFLSLSILLLIPADVTFTRVAASMLPEGDETIVPFDRTFGGRVTPVAVGGTGVVGILDAWKTFSWEARRRYLVLFIKAAAIMAAVTVLFLGLISSEMMMFTEVRQAVTKLVKY